MVVLPIIFVALIAALQGSVWLLLFLREDTHSEPKKLIAYTFGIGAFISIPVVAAQLFSQSVILRYIPNVVLLIFILALIEEVFKFIAAYIAIGKSKYFDEPIDAMVYMVTAALGMATVENFFVLAEFIDVSGLIAVEGALDVITLRFIGATLLHALSSALVGYYWAKGIIRNKPGSFVVWGIFIATIIHAIFNILILVYEQPDLLILPSLFLLVVAVFVFRDFSALQAIGGKADEEK